MVLLVGLWSSADVVLRKIMENFFGVASIFLAILSAFSWASWLGDKPNNKGYRDAAAYYILVAIFCRIAVVTYQMITIAELLQ